MRTSCVLSPPKEPLIIIRKWQVDLCKGNHCAAALLSFLTYWHDIKLEDATREVKPLVQWHSMKDLRDGLIGLYSDDTIRKARKLLGDLKLVTEMKDETAQFDQTTNFLLHPERVNSWLRANKPSEDLQPPPLFDGPTRKTGGTPPKSRVTPLDNSGTPPEKSGITSTETTSETTYENKPPTPKGGITGVELENRIERMKKALCLWQHRKPTTPWSAKELKLLRHIAATTTKAVFHAIESYYTADIPHRQDYRRRDIMTLLNNWNGEADRAERWLQEPADHL